MNKGVFIFVVICTPLYCCGLRFSLHMALNSAFICTGVKSSNVATFGLGAIQVELENYFEFFAPCNSYNHNKTL